MMMTPTTTTAANNINASSGGGSGSGSDDGGSGSGGNNGSSSSTMLKKGPWTSAEDAILMEYVRKHGEGNWNAVQKNSGLSRCGKSCRLRWANHLRPNLKKGSFSPDEERLILELHSKLGNKWARMAAQLPGRTDNEIKNYWNTRVKRRQRAGLPLYPNDVQKQTSSFHHHHQHQHQHQQTSLTHQSFLQPPTQFSSQHQKTNFVSPLPLFDPLNLSTQTHFSSGHHHQTTTNNNNFLSTSINGFKRFRAQNFGFSHQFSPTQVHQTLTPSSSSIMFNQNMSNQFLPPPPLQFNPANYDLMSPPPPPLMQSHYHDQYSNHMSPPGSSFSFQLELPSNQMPQPAAHTAASGNNTNDDMDFKTTNTYQLDDHQSNSGLLDALLQQAQTMRRRSGGGDHHDSRKEAGLVSEQEEEEEEDREAEEKEKCRIDGLDRDASSPSGTLLFSEHTTTTTPPSRSSNQWDESSPANSSIGEKKKEATDNEINSMEDDDLSSLLDIIPSTMMVSDFYNDGGEISNGGQSSGVTDEDTGLDMQLLPSNTNTTTTTNNTANTNTMEHDWSVGDWNNESELCYNQSS